MYEQIYSILVEYIYGNPIALSAYQELTCTQISTMMCLVCVLLPFFAALLICKWVFGR